MKMLTITLIVTLVALLFPATDAVSAEASPLAPIVQRGLFEEEVNRNFHAAAEAYRTALAEFEKDRQLAATAAYRLAELHRRADRIQEANALYERILREFSDQSEIARLAAERLPDGAATLQGAGSGSPSEFSPVTIRIQSEDGRPLAGWHVEMESTGEGRSVVATGESGEDGIGLFRHLPYGSYRLLVTHPLGWGALGRTIRVNVEVGAPFERTFVAPDTSKDPATLILEGIDEDRFQGLRFGSPRGSSHQPEPGEDPGDYAGFPQLNDGISRVTVRIYVAQAREIPQPDGSSLTWRWGLEPFLASEGTFTAREMISTLTRSFGQIRYFRVQGLERQEQPLEVPPGEITVAVRDVLGQPDEATRAALGLDDGSDIWLGAAIAEESAWFAQILDLKKWELEVNERWSLPRRTLTLEPGEEVTLDLASSDEGGE